MSHKLVNIVLEKLCEYGIEVYESYPMKKKSFVIETACFTLFIDLKDKSMGVSFHAATKPEVVSNDTLILNEIDEISRIDIMQSYAYDENRKVVSGEEAFDIIEEQVMKNFVQKQAYMNVLLKEKCFTC